MANQYKNKVVYNGTTLIDISDTTAVQSDVASGKSFYTASGQKVLGTGSTGNAISVVDTTDSHGGTIRTITAVDISDTTAIASDVASGKYFYTANGTKTLGTASGSSGTWETLWDDDVNFTYDSTENYPYCEISTLGSTSILADSVWRITYANTEYICTAKTNGNFTTIGNPKWGGGTDDGSDVPFVFYKTQTGAWAGEVNAPNEQSTYHFKIERQTASPSSPTLITKTITVNGTYSAQSDNADGYSEVTVNVSGSGSSGTGQTATGTVTGDGTNILEIPCNFAPDLIYVYGDMSEDVANRGVTSVMIIKDVAIYASFDSSTSNADEYAIVSHNITGYNESDTSNTHATYSNNTLTIDTVQKSTSSKWRSGQVYNYELSTIGTGGGTPSATAHTIYFEFTDETNTTITGYWDDNFVGNAITATTPTTYGQKTVTSAQLDGVEWYSYTPEPTPSGDWTTVYDSSISVSNRGFVLSSVTDTFTLGDTWRATLDGTAYTFVVQHSDQFQTNYIGNMAIIVDWASTGDPILCYNNTGHIAGNTYLADGSHTLKLERQVSS